MKKDFLSDLNDVQRQAVEAVEGPVLVLAGAGSGKTRTLTYRIAYLVKEKKVMPSRILALTFTNKAAREMKERISALLSKETVPLWIGTFHSIAARILRIEAEQIGFEKNFSIYDVDDQVRAVKKVMSSLGISQQQFPPKLVQSRISRAKNKFLFPQDLKSNGQEGLDVMLPEIYETYQKMLRENNALDFDDLLIKPVELFDRQKKIHEKYADKFQYIMIDEYQDTNHAQYQLIKRLVTKHKNIYVVGDEDQSIYGWRGADINNILSFQKDFPGARVIKLEENYRSDKNILKAANAIVKNNVQRIGKNLWTSREDGEKVCLYVAADEKDEAKHIVEIIHDEMYTQKRSFKDLAILYRTNAQSRIIEDFLRRNAISYTIIGSVRFYDRKEIKDLLSYLKLIANPADSISLKRIINFPLRGIGGATVSKVEKFAEMENITLFEALGRVDEIASISAAMKGNITGFYTLIRKFIDLSSELSAVELTSTLATETGLIHHYKTEYDQYEAESRIANIDELFTSIQQFVDERQKENRDDSLPAFLEEVSLLSDVDSWNTDSNAVTLMTLHAAKGLEFPVVYICGVEDGLIPLQRSTENGSNELEEERRLFYVGITRAQKKVYLSYARRRNRYGSSIDVQASMFLNEIPRELLSVETSGQVVKPRRKVSPRKKKITEYFSSGGTQDPEDSFYRVGQPVYHATFGKGQIVKLEGRGANMKVTVHFTQNNLIKKLIKQYANLTPLEG